MGIDVRNRRGVVHLAEHFGEAPVIVAPVLIDAGACADSRHVGAGLGSSIYGAVQNLMLAARAFDIGTVFTWTLDDTSGFNELLGLPENARVMCLIPLGYLEKGRFSQSRRRRSAKSCTGTAGASSKTLPSPAARPARRSAAAPRRCRRGGWRRPQDRRASPGRSG